ncbi:MAG: hypothetical protein FGM24_00665 [Candidatus Kapabacteria bacterium]|nr:hypothetical protein [Candidatus Kapabacteria bacterium]
MRCDSVRAAACQVLLLALLTGVCSGQGTVQVSFAPSFRGAALEFDTTVYRTTRGADVTVSMLKFYVSNLELRGRSDTVRLAGEHFLMDLSDPDRMAVSMRAPSGTYNALRFTIGVDSSLNESGPREGALDPRHGMYWTWATGYIFSKIEGTVTTPQLSRRMFEIHIGGFKAPCQNTVTIDVPFTHPVKVADQQMDIVIDVAVDAFFDADGGFDIAARPSVTDARQAVDVAPRWRKMFRANE